MRKLTAWLLLASIYIGFIAPFARTEAQIINKGIVQKANVDLSSSVPDGFKFTLREGSEGATARQRSGPAATEPIDDPSSLLKRLPAIKQEKDDTADFAKRAGSRPAPKTGNKIPVKFPADGDRAPAGQGSNQSLQVLRFSPEGEIGLAPDLSVTFSQPMVAVTSQEQAARYVPVELTPNVEGRWRWLGTKTLMFDTDKRFPMATRFTARVPKGTKSANGLTLATDVTWTFTTPAPKVEHMHPNGQIVKRDAIIYLAFDQQINPEAVLPHVSVTAGGRRMPLRLATPEEQANDGGISSAFTSSYAKRWLAFRAVNADDSTHNALPGASEITVTVGKGTPSAEGPLTSTEVRKFNFLTFGPLALQKAICGWEGNKECSPFENWYLQFNNTIDASKFDAKMITIEPAITGLNIFPSGNHIYIQGYKKGNTTYKITVDGSLSDSFGQTLGKSAIASVRVGSAPANFYAQGGPMIVLDPAGSRSLSIYSTNHSGAKVRMYRVEPSDWGQYQAFIRGLDYDDGRPKAGIPGRLISDRVVAIANKPDEMVETRLDLSGALEKDGLGHLLVIAEPTAKRGEYDRSRVVTWIQSTNIGLDAFVDNGELVGFATDLRTGKPLAGVNLSIKPNGAAAGGEQTGAVEEQKGVLRQAWDWVMGFAGGGPSAESTEAIDQDGALSIVESIQTTQADTTPASGVLRLRLPASQSQGEQNYLVAQRGRDTAFLPEQTDYFWERRGSWYEKPSVDSLRWFVFDDRKMYKPKEEVAVKGYLRKITGGELGDVEGLGRQTLTHTWVARDARGAEITKGTVTTNPFGAFDFKFNLPDNVNLGDARIEFSPAGSTSVVYSHDFQIQEFRRPEFEVTAKVETPAPHFIKESAMLSVDAKYYAGGGLANAPANWTVTATPTNYTPPNRDEYTFGTWTPWWRHYDFYGRGYYGGQTQNFQGVTDASGRHLLKIDFESVKPARPYTLSASASVSDVNRQTWAGQTTLLVHPANLYIGIKTPRTFVQKGDVISVDSIVTDLDGKLIAGRDAEITAVLKDWVFEKGTWKETTVDEQTCTARSAEQAQQCKFTAKAGGRYTIRATVIDDRERPNQSEFTVWVAGGKTPPKRNVEQEQVEIIPSKKDFAPSDLAELLVIAPFAPAEGVLTLRREGVAKVERFSMKDSSITLKIPLEEKYLPNLIAQVDIVGSAPRQNDKGEVDPKLANRPAFATGEISLPISTASRKLTVAAEAVEKTLIPGASTKVNVTVTDHRGEPVADSEVALAVVDESVLALSRYSVPDPVAAFYAMRSDSAADYHSRKDILLTNPEDAKSSPPPPPPAVAGATVDVSAQSVEALPMMGRNFRSELRADAKAKREMVMDGQDVIRAEGDQAIALRQNFNALALWSPTVRTNGSGRASLDLKLPDNLTRYRVTAVAVDSGKRFGKGESDITAKQPLMVRPSAPRFLNFGDKAEVPVVIQNQTDKDMAVDVAMRATNVSLDGNSTGEGVQAAGKRVVVKANDRAEVRFPVSTVRAGTARFQFAASAGTYSDAAEISLPVWTPATTEAFATYGSTDQNGAIFQPVQAPGDVYSEFGGLEVTTSSTQLQELTDAYIYLANYPYGCSEQIASRMISTAALRDVLNAFKSKDMPSPEALAKQFESDIAVLRSRQRDDGSFGLWRRDRERYEYPFLTVHVAHALALAKAKGYKVPDEMLDRTKSYLKNIESRLNDEWHKSSPQVRWSISAYALYIRDLMGDKDAGKAKKILAEATLEKLNFEALGWILSVLATDEGSAAEVSAIARFLMNRTTETASTANFVTEYGDGAWLIMYSNRRADGILLEALIKAQGRGEQENAFGDLIPKIVRGLLAHRTKGHWGSTQENVFILLALDKYFAAYESVTPDFVARVWLGNAYAGEQVFKGRSVDSNQLEIPMSYLVGQGGASNLIVDRQGAGRLYYRIGMKYAPRNLKLDPADYGFTVLRTYEPVDDKEDVKQNADGSWTVKSGSRVRVRLTMVAQARRYHVALVDNLPAGFEILNPELATTETIPADAAPRRVGAGDTKYGGRSLWLRQYWFDHQNFRDERAEAFSALLYEGVYTYSFVVRATTPGSFVAPPAKAEEMYMPETFGRTGTDFVTVR
jgi:alpha-2-macroglobulin